MKNPENAELARLTERLNRLESRLASLEQQSRANEQVLRRLQRRSWFEKFRPRLWDFEQYAPREVLLPDAYKNERPPDNPPRIAIVTPSYNQGRFLRATIESILGQNYPNLDYVVRDGGSTDETPAVLASYKESPRWRSERDRGQADAINRGFAEARGEIMAYLNSDDTLLPGALAYVARTFVANPKIDLIYGHRLVIDADGRETARIILPRHDPAALKWFDYVPQETLFWRRRVWEKIGPFDESFQFALDWDFLLRAQEAGFRFLRVPRFLACFRFHSDQKTATMQDVCDRETRRIWKLRLGFEPTAEQHARAIRVYLVRHVVAHRLYKLGLSKF